MNLLPIQQKTLKRYLASSGYAPARTHADLPESVQKSLRIQAEYAFGDTMPRLGNLAVVTTAWLQAETAELPAPGTTLGEMTDDEFEAAYRYIKRVRA